MFLYSALSIVALFSISTSACARLHASHAAGDRAVEAPEPDQNGEADSLGAGKELTFAEFRQAVEHYEVGVRRGNTEALRETADSYAVYLLAFHRHLHLEFAQRFLGRVPTGVFADPRLTTKVEVVIEPDGSLNRLGVIKTSGDVRFDFEVFNAVQRGAPYPPPPDDIRSPDGRTYLRWTLHRDTSQCGTWNAEPYILSWTLAPESRAAQGP